MKIKQRLLSFFIVLFCTIGSFALSSSEVKLMDKAKAEGMTLYWDPLSLSGILEKNGHQITFQSGGNFILKDNLFIVDQKAPYVKDGDLVSTVSFFNEAQQFFLEDKKIISPKQEPLTTAIGSSGSYNVGVILIDPGHGGKDPGASAVHTIGGKQTTVVEKNINLDVALKLYDYLRKAYPTKKIMMTRDKDVFVSLEDRTKIANSVKLNQNEAILYVSIHVNASLATNASGYEVWYLSPGYRRQVIDTSSIEDKTLSPIINSLMEEEYTTESILLANFIQNGINSQVNSLSTSRGIKADEWFVVRNTYMPSVLIETGFLTNAKEAELLTDSNYLKKLSFGIYNGLQAFITHFERTRGFTSTR